MAIMAFDGQDICPICNERILFRFFCPPHACSAKCLEDLLKRDGAMVKNALGGVEQADKLKIIVTPDGTVKLKA